MVGEALMTPRVYGIADVGPDANRIVGMQELDARYPERMVRVREEMFAPNGIAAQLRVVFGDPHLLGFVGVYRFSRTRGYDEDDVALFEAVLPDLRRALAVWRAIGRAPLPRGLVGDVLDALDQPAYILAGAVVLFADGVARGVPLPEWLDAVGRGHVVAGERFGATVRRLEVEGRSFTLVLAPRATGQRSIALPRWLARVAEVAAEGLSDKEIAERLSMPLATVRTAMQRIYARMGVHSRAELVRRCLEARGDAQPRSGGRRHDPSR
ncbi:MAG: LuxR C-terminal-related transcriptional regulator [Myxococcota bacterium]|nr:LuxR C-terminal-related transcriptional regulator [Myxococcota bacterium]